MNAFRKFVLFGLMAALLLAAVPTSTALAAGSAEGKNPPSQPVETTFRLEQAFARQKLTVERHAHFAERADQMVQRIQGLIDQATEKGLDVSAVQTALDAFESSAAEVKASFVDAEKLVQTHSGFDANGKVVDEEKAKATVEALRDVLQQNRESMKEPFQQLREAIKAFRDANPRPNAAPTPAAP